MRRFSFGRHSIAPLLPLALAACGVTAADHEKPSVVTEDLSIAASSLVAADIGSGYDTGKEAFVLSCITGGGLQQGQSAGTVTIDRTVDKNTVTSSLGLNVGLKARYSMFSADASANFTRSLTDDAYSESFVFYGDYDYGQTVLDSNNFQLTKLGQSARDQGIWQDVCGNEFVSSVRKGARFYFVLRVDFESTDAKETFDQTANLSVSGGVYSVNLTDKLTLGMNAVGNHAHFHAEAMQLGGDPIKIGSVIQGLGGTVVSDPNKPSAAEAVLDCSNGDAKSCVSVMKNALDYASSSAPGSLQDQLKDPSKLAPIGYTTLPWINLAIQGTPQLLTQDLMNQRELLSQKFERLAQSRNRVERIINAHFTLPPAISQKLADVDSALVASDALFTAAVGACYETLKYDHDSGQLLPASVTACTNAVAAIKDINVDPELLEGAAAYEIDEKAGQYALLGAPTATFSTGDPNAQPRDCVSQKTADGHGKYCDFTSGTVYWQPDFGAHEVDGQIAGRYNGAFGALSPRTQGPLGFPTSDVGNTPDGQGRYATFEHGAIYYTPRGQTFASYGPIGDYYAAHGLQVNKQLVPGGAPQGPLGYPTSEAAYTSDFRGQYATFVNGALLYTSGGGVHQINGGERDYWLGHYGQLGFAITDSYYAPGAQGDGVVTQFQQGVLAWHPSYGLKWMQFDLFPRWDQDRKNWLGFPLGDEVFAASDNVHYQQFQGGYVWKNGSDPAIGVKQDIMSAWQRTYGTPFNPGHPQSEEVVKTLNQKATGRMQNFGGGVVLAGPRGTYMVWGALWWNLLLRDPGSSTEYNCGWPTSDNMLGSKFFGVPSSTAPGHYIDNYGKTIDDWYVQTYEQGWMAATLDGKHAWVQCKDRHGRP